MRRASYKVKPIKNVREIPVFFLLLWVINDPCSLGNLPGVRDELIAQGCATPFRGPGCLAGLLVGLGGEALGVGTGLEQGGSRGWAFLRGRRSRGGVGPRAAPEKNP